MKSIRTLSFFSLLVASLLIAGDGYAQKGPRDGRRDSTGHKMDNRGRMGNLVHFFVRQDSCREILLSQMSSEDAATFSALVDSAKSYHAQMQELREAMHEARKARDREAFRALSLQMRELQKKIMRVQHAMGELLRKYQEAAKRIFVDCGPHRKPHREDNKGETGERIMIRASINPNPATAEGTNLLLNLETPATIGITIADRAGTVISEIAATEYAAGQHTIAITTSNLQPGMYYVRLQSGAHVQTLKLVIQ